MHSFWLLLLLFEIKLYSHIDILKEIGSHNCHNLCLSKCKWDKNHMTTNTKSSHQRCF